MTSPGRSVGVQSRVPLPADKILADLHARGAHVIWACCVRLGRGLVLLLRPQGGGRRRVFRREPGFRRDLDVGRSSVPDRASVGYVGGEVVLEVVEG